MANAIEMALHSRAHRLLNVFLRRHGLGFFLEQREDEHFSRIDDNKVDLVLTLASQGGSADLGNLTDQPMDAPNLVLSCRSMLRRILIRRLAFDLVEEGY